jgi:hypothetical protein
LRIIRQQGFDWEQNRGSFLSLHFGEGMQNLWTEQTQIDVDGKTFDLSKVLEARGEKRKKKNYF